MTTRYAFRHRLRNLRREASRARRIANCIEVPSERKTLFDGSSVGRW